MRNKCEETRKEKVNRGEEVEVDGTLNIQINDENIEDCR